MVLPSCQQRAPWEGCVCVGGAPQEGGCVCVGSPWEECVCVRGVLPSLALPSEGLGPVSWKAALQRAWQAPVPVVGAGRVFCCCLCAPGGETRPPALPGMGWG